MPGEIEIAQHAFVEIIHREPRQDALEIPAVQHVELGEGNFSATHLLHTGLVLAAPGVGEFQPIERMAEWLEDGFCLARNRGAPIHQGTEHVEEQRFGHERSYSSFRGAAKPRARLEVHLSFAPICLWRMPARRYAPHAAPSPGEGHAMVRTLEQSTMRKVYLRLLPFAILTYFFCYLDRINVGFAALTMNKDLGLDASMFGMAAGAFFWGYCLFEVPSNMIMEKVGARIWIARIMITWGILSGATALCTGPYSFMTVRFLLGVAEAGFFPGIVLFFTYWFPDRHRARIVSGFMLAL